MIKKPELLAPAGDLDSFRAAVENGADAIYLGGRLFNARQFAGNFGHEELKQALDYAHIRGKNIYFTMNTLLADNELQEALDFTGQAYMLGIDGIIVQDLGFAALVKKIFPDLPLHASTQMTVYNLEGVKFLERYGFKRAVLARELSLKEISRITEAASIEIEIFVHGALCVCYSGQCLMSSIFGGRSGNRGKCAQPCRLPYKLCGPEGDLGEGYLLSPKDLCGIDMLESIAGSGVSSLKIEGRMKSPEYVATVVSIYRKYIDEIAHGDFHGVSGKDTKDLLQIFNRGGFSHGYLEGKTGRDMMSYDKPKNWGIELGKVESYDPVKKEIRVILKESLATGDGIEIWTGGMESPGTVVSSIKVEGTRTNEAAAGSEAVIGYVAGGIKKGQKVFRTSQKSLNEAARASLGRTGKFVGLKAGISIRKGMPVLFEISDNDGNFINTEGPVPEEAIHKPLEKDKVIAQLNKTGGTPFYFSDIEVELDDNVSVASSALNMLRRDAFRQLETKLVHKYARNYDPNFVEFELGKVYFPGNSRNSDKDSELKFSVYVFSGDANKEYWKLGAERIYLPVGFIQQKAGTSAADELKKMGVEVYAWLPPVTRGFYDDLFEGNPEGILQLGIDGLMAGNIGSLAFAGTGLPMIGDHTLNIFNSSSVNEYRKAGLKGITLSPELDAERLKKLTLPQGFEIEALVYGRLALMTMEYCPAGSIAGGFGNGKHCSGVCGKGIYRLRDRKGMEFPLIADRYSCRSMILNSNVMFLPELAGRIVQAGVRSLRFNMFDESVEEMREIIELYRDAADSGQSYKSKHADVIERIRQKGFSRGHYMRGV